MKFGNLCALGSALVMLSCLTACGGGGGGGAKDPEKTPAPEVPASDPVVDTTVYTTAAADVGSALSLHGVNSVPLQSYPVGQGWVASLGDGAVSLQAALGSATDITALPGTTSFTLGIDGLASGTQALPVSTLSMVASDHRLAGQTLRRFASGVQPTGVNLCAAVVDPAAVGIRYTKLAYWKYQNRFTTGSGFSNDIIRGAAVLGVPTLPTVVAGLGSASYTGVAAGGIQSDLQTVSYGFDELSSNVLIAYDSGSRKVAVTLTGFEHYQNDCLTGGLNARQSLGLSFPRFEGFNCEADVDTVSNTFRCTAVTQDNELDWEIRGRFFGPGGREVAGTVSIRGQLTSSARSEGAALAFSAAKPVTP